MTGVIKPLQRPKNALFSTSITWMFSELPFIERVAAAARAGFAGVEIQQLGDIPPAQIAESAERAGVRIALINVSMGDLLEGGPGLSGVPGREESFRRELDRAIEAARTLKASTLHLGPSRIPSGVGRAECLAVYRRNVALACESTVGTGIVPVIEPMNRVDAPDVLLGEIELARAMIAEHSGLGLLFDTYHVAKSGHDAAHAFTRYKKDIAHVQISDAPGRTAPGTGIINWTDFFSAVRDSGYGGWIGAEYPATEALPVDFRWLDQARANLAQGFSA